jgi:hypothetical protein
MINCRNMRFRQSLNILASDGLLIYTYLNMHRRKRNTDQQTLRKLMPEFNRLFRKILQIYIRIKF